MLVNHSPHLPRSNNYPSGAMQVWLASRTCVAREPCLCYINGMQVPLTSACPVLTIQVAIADGFGQVGGLDVLAAFEVGDGARNL